METTSLKRDWGLRLIFNRFPWMEKLVSKPLGLDIKNLDIVPLPEKGERKNRDREVFVFVTLDVNVSMSPLKMHPNPSGMTTNRVKRKRRPMIKKDFVFLGRFFKRDISITPTSGKKL